jgi:hypothetical protein
VPTKTENAPETFHLNDPYLVPVTFQAKPTFNLNTDAAPLSPTLTFLEREEQKRERERNGRQRRRCTSGS